MEGFICTLSMCMVMLYSVLLIFQEAYIDYCSELADRAADLLVTRLGTHKFLIPREMEAPYMRLIRAPDMPGIDCPQEDTSLPVVSAGLPYIILLQIIHVGLSI